MHSSQQRGPSSTPAPQHGSSKRSLPKSPPHPLSPVITFLPSWPVKAHPTRAPHLQLCPLLREERHAMRLISASRRPHSATNASRPPPTIAPSTALSMGSATSARPRITTHSCAPTSTSPAYETTATSQAGTITTGPTTPPLVVHRSRPLSSIPLWILASKQVLGGCKHLRRDVM